MTNNNRQQEEQRKNEIAELAKQQVKNKAKKAGKKIAMQALKKAALKAAALLSSKVGVVLAAVIGIFILVGLFIALLTPDMSKAHAKLYETGVTKEEVREQLLRYTTLSSKYNLLDLRYGIMMDMGQTENENLMDLSPDENIFHLFKMHYIEYTPTLLACEVLVPATNEDGTTEIDDDGNPVMAIGIEIRPYYGDENDVDSYPEGCTIHQPKKIYREEMLEKKDAILDFMSEKDALTIEGEYPKRKFIVDDAKLYYPFFPHIPFITVEISYFGKQIEVAMEDAKFNKDQKEHVDILLQMPEAINELFAEYDVSIFGNYIGSGAYCVKDGEVDETKISSVLDSAGVFNGHLDDFKQVADKYNIDIVLMISIALHETGNGTSNAVVNKNNPGGLMNPATGSKELFEYSSLTEGIEAMGYTLNNRINKDGLVTIEDLGNVYAPVGAENDPNGLNQHWKGGIGKNVSALGGLTMNCEKYTGTNITFSGDVSELRKTLASIGTQWIGNSTYVFGGGRSQSDINRGWFDCSSFVHWAYQQAGINLGNLSSTSTETLNKMGRQIPMSEIQVGDLVFWDTYKNDGHVGIYIGNGKFIGAQSSQGVAIVDLNNPYWSSKFSGHVRTLVD